MENKGKITEIDVKRGRVVVETDQPWPELLSEIEKTGLRAALTGFGGQAAVSIVDVGQEGTAGVIRFTSPDSSTRQIVVDGVVDGLQPGREYKVQIHECGDLSQGCASVGDLFGRQALGNTIPGPNGRTSFRFSSDQFAVSELIGRSAAIVDATDTRRVVCGIIARAAGINQNFKKICACDGISLWDERNVPVAGGERGTFQRK